MRVISPWRALWGLDPEVVYLEHGAFGACPRHVLSRQQHLRECMERQPIRFFDDLLEPWLGDARARLARFVGADPRNVNFVPNVTTGVSCILRSLRFVPGDELLVSDLEFTASRRALEHVARRDGATVKTVELPLPIRDSGDVVERILGAIGRRTKLVLLSHVTSSTGIVLPLDEIVPRLRERGVRTLIDGAHAPGMIALDLERLGATYYVANCHKWVSAPKGAAFIHVHGDAQSEVGSWVSSYNPGLASAAGPAFHDEFLWTGTADYTPYLCVGEALDHLESAVAGGWPAIMQRNREIALRTRALLASTFGGELLAPESMTGSMAVAPLKLAQPWEAAHKALLERFSIEVAFIPWRPTGSMLVRASFHLYNTPEDGEYLNKSLQALAADLRELDERSRPC